MIKCTHEIYSTAQRWLLLHVLIHRLTRMYCMIISFATVMTAIPVAAIKGQGGCSLSKIDSNKHLLENSTNPSEWRLFMCPNPTCVNDYTESEGDHAQYNEKSISAIQTSLNHK